jgi:hypothetical protein
MTKVWPHGAHATASAAGSITSHTFFASRRILAQVRLGTGIPFMRAQPHTASIKYKIEKLASTDYDHMFCLGPMRVALAAHVAAHACYDSARAAVYYVTPPPPAAAFFRAQSSRTRLAWPLAACSRSRPRRGQRG